MPRNSAFARQVLGDSVDWSVDTHLLAKIAHLAAGANWQRGGGKGQKPKPIKPPKARPRRSHQARRADGERRMRNLGLLPGHAKPPPRPLTPQGQALAAAIERARAANEHPPPTPM